MSRRHRARRPLTPLVGLALAAFLTVTSASAGYAAESFDPGQSEAPVPLAADAVQAEAEAVPANAGTFVSLEPARLLDTRVGNGASQAVPANGTVVLQVTGRGGVPQTGVSAVIVNVTVTSPGAGGFITVYPAGGAQPTASNLNFNPGQTIPNLVTVKVSSEGTVAFTNNSPRSVHLIADVAGYYLAGTPTEAGAFVSLDPARILDTRIGNGAPRTAVAANSFVRLQVTGRGGIPASGVSAVVVNVTVTGPAASGFVTVHPAGTTPPNASNLNFNAGQSIPNLVTVKVGDGGRIDLRNNSTGAVNLIADVAGYYLAGTPTVPGAFVSVDPARILDTRVGTGAAQAAVPGGESVGLQVADRGSIPAVDAAAVVMNVTVTGPQSSGFVTAFPYGTEQPTASNVNYTAGQNIPNLVTVMVGVNGKVELANNSGGSAHLIADVAGYFLGSPDEADPVWPTGWIFDDCGVDGDALLVLLSPGIEYSPGGSVVFFDGEWFNEYLPGNSGAVTVTASAEPGYVMLSADGTGWTQNPDGSITITVPLSTDPCF